MIHKIKKIFPFLNGRELPSHPNDYQVKIIDRFTDQTFTVNVNNIVLANNFDTRETGDHHWSTYEFEYQFPTIVGNVNTFDNAIPNPERFCATVVRKQPNH